jgi:fructose-1,6-bisphosphatase II
LGGEIQARLVPDGEEELARVRQMGLSDPYKMLTLEDMVRGDDVFFAATGITDGDMLRGVRYRGQTAETHSLVMRGITGTIRNIDAIHLLSRKPHYVARQPRDC